MGKKNGETTSKAKNQQSEINENKSVYSLAVKCYDEQLIGGKQGLEDHIRAIGSSEYQILAIRHDRDKMVDEAWEMAAKKPHYHIIMRHTERGHRDRINKLLEMLGIFFRPGIDDNLWKNHGVETVGRFSNYAMYLTHETEKAINEGKERYDKSELITNLSDNELNNIREGYKRASSKRQVTIEKLERLDTEAYKLGYDLKNFDEWYGKLPFVVRSHPKMKTIRESYDRGVNARVEKGTEITRLCIFIQGQANSGKSFSTKKALSGKRVLSVGGGGTGMFDNLRPDHEAIIIDDDECPNLLNMSDNYICYAYRRQKSNPAWAGQYLVVTSNLSFIDWVKKCGIIVHDKQGQLTEHYRAVKSRFYICEILSENEPTISLISPSNRGSKEVKLERDRMYIEFSCRFNYIVHARIKSEQKTDPNTNHETIMKDELSVHLNEWQSTYEEMLKQITEMYKQNNQEFYQLPFRDWMELGTIDYDNINYDELGEDY